MQQLQRQNDFKQKIENLNHSSKNLDFSFKMANPNELEIYQLIKYFYVKSFRQFFFNIFIRTKYT